MTIPVFVCEEHHEALECLHWGIRKKKIPIQNLTMVHFDSHPDLSIEPCITADLLDQIMGRPIIESSPSKHKNIESSPSKHKNIESSNSNQFCCDGEDSITSSGQAKMNSPAAKKNKTESSPTTSPIIPDLYINNKTPIDLYNALKSSNAGIASWIIPAVYMGNLGRVIWVKQSFCEQIPIGEYFGFVGRTPNPIGESSTTHNTDQSLTTHNTIRVDIPLDYFKSDQMYCTDYVENPNYHLYNGLLVNNMNGLPVNNINMNMKKLEKTGDMAKAFLENKTSITNRISPYDGSSGSSAAIGSRYVAIGSRYAQMKPRPMRPLPLRKQFENKSKEYSSENCSTNNAVVKSIDNNGNRILSETCKTEYHQSEYQPEYLSNKQPFLLQVVEDLKQFEGFEAGVPSSDLRHASSGKDDMDERTKGKDDMDERSPWILDIDLDYFTTHNPFALGLNPRLVSAVQKAVRFYEQADVNYGLNHREFPFAEWIRRLEADLEWEECCEIFDDDRDSDVGENDEKNNSDNDSCKDDEMDHEMNHERKKDNETSNDNPIDLLYDFNPSTKEKSLLAIAGEMILQPQWVPGSYDGNSTTIHDPFITEILPKINEFKCWLKAVHTKKNHTKTNGIETNHTNNDTNMIETNHTNNNTNSASINPPKLITIARSCADNFLPMRYSRRVEAGVLKALCEVFSRENLSIKYSDELPGL